MKKIFISDNLVLYNMNWKYGKIFFSLLLLRYHKTQQKIWFFGIKFFSLNSSVFDNWGNISVFSILSLIWYKIWKNLLLSSVKLEKNLFLYYCEPNEEIKDFFHLFLIPITEALIWSEVKIIAESVEESKKYLK